METKHWIAAFLVAFAGMWVSAADTGRVTIRQVDYRYLTATAKTSLHGVSRELSVSPEVVLLYNPWAGQGVEKGYTVLTPVEVVDAPVVTSGAARQYTLNAGENIYTVSHRFNTSVEALVAANPTVHPDDYVAGKSVVVTPGTATPITVERTNVTFEHYKLCSGDSFYMLAKKNNLTEAELHAANPGIEQLKKGKYINLPTFRRVSVSNMPCDLSVAELRAYYGPRVDALYAAARATLKSRSLNIAMVLPFQLHKAQPPRQALLYTDFYKGFLLALDSLERRGDAPEINLMVLDTQHNLNVTDSLLATGVLDEMNVIIAPGEPQQFLRIATYGACKGIDVLNCFAAKSDLHLTNRNVFQANPSMSTMTAVVTDWLVERFAGHNIVLLNEKAGEDSEAFNMLKNQLDLAGKSVTVLNVGTGELSYDDVSLEMLPGSEYLFIPSNSSKSFLKRILPALKTAKNERVDCDMQLLGYPEYVTYLKEFQSDLCQVDTYIFSRFFNSNGFRTRNVESSYNKWFKGQMLTSYPNMVLYGFDTAMFLATSCNAVDGIETDESTVRGIQTPYRFIPIDEGGCENVAVCVAHFAPDKTIETIVR